MPSGEEDIKPSNPPTEIEPDVTTVAELGESEEEAKDQPREKHHERGFKEDGLRLRELLDSVEGEQRLCEGYSLVADVFVGGDSRRPAEDLAAS